MTIVSPCHSIVGSERGVGHGQQEEKEAQEEGKEEGEQSKENQQGAGEGEEAVESSDGLLSSLRNQFAGMVGSPSHMS